MSSSIPEIKWINHSCFIYDDGEARIISDPWLEGTAFDNGWSLLTETKMPYSEFANVTHIWVSHEHPDHFSPVSLEKIPVEFRAQITFLYQKTEDKRVINFCRKYKFKDYVELSEDQWIDLSSSTKIRCLQSRFETNDDSMLLFKHPKAMVLNINDCVVPNAARMSEIKAIAGDVDVLLAQFSYAGWAGNKDQQQLRQQIASKNLEQFINYVHVFNPKYAIPSASFVYFSNEENSHMNKESVTIQEVTDTILSKTKATPVVLYPGDQWQVHSAHNNDAAMASYKADYSQIGSGRPLIQNPTREVSDLVKLSGVFSEKLKKNNSRFLLAFFPTAKIYVTDLKQAFLMNKNGLTPAVIERDKCDVALGSAGLAYCLTFLWGGDTLNINGRFEKPPQGKFWHFRIYFAAASLNNIGIGFDFKYVLSNLGIVLRKLVDYVR